MLVWQRQPRSQLQKASNPERIMSQLTIVNHERLPTREARRLADTGVFT